MSRRRRICRALMIVAVGSLAVWIVATLWFPRQPVHQGRTVTEWSLDLLSPSPPVRSNATLALQSIGPDAVPVLVRQLRQRDSWLHAPFIALAPHLPVSWRRAFMRSFRPFRAINERYAAAAALPLFSANLPVPMLLATLRHADRQIAGQAATALGRIGADAVPGLIEALEDPSPDVRSLGCYALSQIGPPAAPAAPQLATLLSDPAPQIMELAAYTLSTVGSTAIPHLITALDHPQARVREKVAAALSQFRFAATNAVPALERLLEDGDPAVRRQAHAAIRAIAPGRVPPE